MQRMVWQASILAALALVALVYFSEQAVERLTRLAHHWGLSGTFIGLTVFSLATSLPELLSALVGSAGILSGELNYSITSAAVIGGNVGSDVFQQTIVLATAILLTGAYIVDRRLIKTALAPMTAVAALLLLVSIDGTLSRFDGFLLITSFIMYNVYLYTTQGHNTPEPEASKHPAEDVLISLVQLGLLVVAAHILFESIIHIVEGAGLQGSLIGVLALGIAAASPELSTAFSSARRGENGMSFGVLIGSNITNPALILGLAAIISTLQVPLASISWDMPVKLVIPLLLLAYLSWHTKLNRRVAGGLIASYAFYIVVRITLFAVD